MSPFLWPGLNQVLHSSQIFSSWQRKKHNLCLKKFSSLYYHFRTPKDRLRLKQPICRPIYRHHTNKRIQPVTMDLNHIRVASQLKFNHTRTRLYSNSSLKSKWSILMGESEFSGHWDISLDTYLCPKSSKKLSLSINSSSQLKDHRLKIVQPWQSIQQFTCIYDLF